MLLQNHLVLHPKTNSNVGPLEKQLKSVDELSTVLQNAWDNIPVCVIQKLQNSISKRIRSVLKLKGGHTKY